MTNYDWVCVLEKETPSARRRVYTFMAEKEFKKEKERQLKKEKQKELSEQREALKNKLEKSHSRCYIHTSHKKDKSVRKIRGCQSLLFGRPLVFDLALQKQTIREARHLMQQLQRCYGLNINHPEPFHLHLTGISEHGNTANELSMNLNPEKYFMDFHKKDVSDVFPRDRLVYLTHYSKTRLRYNNDDIYIIGGAIDLHDSKPYALAKAKELGIRSACIPLSSFFRCV